MVSYKPLMHLLIERDISREQLRQLIGAGKSTMSKIFTGKMVALDVIERICLSLRVPVSSVVEFVPDEDASGAPPAKEKGD